MTAPARRPSAGHRPGRHRADRADRGGVRQSPAVAEQLVAAGADPNAKDETVQSAYLISTSEVGDDPRLLRLLLDHGADVESLDSWRGTGLIRAADRGFHRIVITLLDTPIKIDHVNRIGYTALHEAVVLGDGGPAHQRTVAALVRGRSGHLDRGLAGPHGAAVRPRTRLRPRSSPSWIEWPRPPPRSPRRDHRRAASSAGRRSRSVVRARNTIATVTSCSGRCTTSIGSPAPSSPEVITAKIGARTGVSGEHLEPALLAHPATKCRARNAWRRHLQDDLVADPPALSEPGLGQIQPDAW